MNTVNVTMTNIRFDDDTTSGDIAFLKERIDSAIAEIRIRQAQRRQAQRSVINTVGVAVDEVPS